LSLCVGRKREKRSRLCVSVSFYATTREAAQIKGNPKPLLTLHVREKGREKGREKRRD
jgi:hypothetical protein